MSQNPPSFPSRRVWWLLAFLVITTGLAWGAYAWLVNNARTKVNDRLAERGLVLKARSETWSLRGGITLQEAVLARLDGGQEPLVEISALQVDVLWREAWAERAAVTRWRAEDAILVLHDEEGSVTLKKFTTDFIVRRGKTELTRVAAQDGSLSLDLTGEILPVPPGPAPENRFELRLKALRATLNTLRFEPGSGPFRVTGDFTVDRAKTPMTWNANLRGEGQDVNWRGLPMRAAVVQGTASDAGLNLACDLRLLKGGARLAVARAGWAPAPITLKGTLTDEAGRSSEFDASYDGPAKVLTVPRLAGDADLLELASTFPPLAEHIPEALTVKKFPRIEAQDFVWDSGAQPAQWSLARLDLKTPAQVVVTVREHPVAVDAILGQVSRKGGAWHFHDFKGRLLEGSFTLDGDYDGGHLGDAKVSLKSLRLARLSPWLGKVSAGLDDSDLSLTYRGTICDQPVRSTGSGSLVLTHAPVVHIPLLEQTYALFPKLLPDKGKDGTGEFQVEFSMTKGVATIDPFKGRSQALTVTATGTVDLVKRRVDGHARANLRGVVGVVTSPLSHVLTDMEISGPLDDIRVSPEGPVSGVKKLLGGTAKVAKGSVKLSGAVLKEGLTLPFEALGMFGQKKEKTQSKVGE